MIAMARSAALHGLSAVFVRVEVEVSRGVPAFELVGLAEAAVRESRVRVRSALMGLGVDMNELHVVVNLAPADVKKTGSGFDLAIAVAVLSAIGRLPPESLQGVLFVGELSLSGRLSGVRGALPQFVAARQRRRLEVIAPRANEAEAALVNKLDIRLADTLAEVVAFLRGEGELLRPRPVARPAPDEGADDLTDVRGQASARRALEVSAAGAHNLLMVGPPGAGKTMLARRIGGILPELSHDEALEVMAVHSVAGLLARGAPPTYARPFRAPHHTVSDVALTGGGDPPRPGEVSLAHRGVLFLDELGEFKRSALESLREPLEHGSITISRAGGKATFFAEPMLVCAMNPCPCGYLGARTRPCVCRPERVQAYKSRLSGPLLDRLDVHVALPPVDVAALAARTEGESSRTVRERVLAARARQSERQRGLRLRSSVNARLSPREVDAVAEPCEAGKKLLFAAIDRLRLSARAYGKVLRVARTLADLDGSATVRVPHVAEAIGLRLQDRDSESRGAAA